MKLIIKLLTTFTMDFVKHSLLIIFIFLTSCAVTPSTQQTSLSLASVFSDNMVLQRDKPIRVWGEGEPGSIVKVTLGSNSQNTKAADNGEWHVELPALGVGDPLKLTVNADGQTLEFENILIGDVWLCSGQSNMAWPVSKSTGPKPWAEQTPNDIRLLTVPRDYTSAPLQNLRKSAVWQLATAEQLNEFSSVCAHFAETLNKADGIPLGLIHSSWGGAQIEAWMSAEALRASTGFDSDLQLLDQYVQNPKQGEQIYAQQWQQWWLTKSSAKPWLEPVEDDWTAVNEFVNWKLYPDTALKNHNGLVWYHLDFQVTEEQAKQGAKLRLGGIDEVDLTWLNGELVGTQFGWGTPRNYNVSKGQLKVGQNSLVVNVLSTYGDAGLVGPAEAIAIEFENGERLPLAQGWRYKKVPGEYGYPRSSPWESINGLTGLYNAMIAPLRGLNMSGVLWYQGESNTGRAMAYTELLQNLIEGWRKDFGDGLPFLVVQLPNFGEPNIKPGYSGWAQLRNNQWLAVRDDANSGLVVTIDIGDAKDLHPTNKLNVGKRAAQVAMAISEKADGIIHGIYPSKVVNTNKELIVSFEPSSEVLKVQGSQGLTEFELCNETCIRVDAELKNNKIYIDKSALKNAKKIRYCWADAPECYLVGKSGISVSSFETVIK